MQRKAQIGIAGGAVALLLGLLLLVAAPASAKVESLKPTHSTPRALVFDVRGLRAKAIDRAWVRMAGRGRMVKKRVRASLVSSRAKRGGRLRVRRPQSVRSGKLTVVTAPAAGPIATPPPAPADLKVGIIANTQAWGPDTGQFQDQVAQTGADWMREEFDWDVIQPRQGTWDWSRYDRLMTESASRGLMILPVLMSTPAWAGQTWDTIPSDPSAYAAYVAQVVARYGPGGDFWAAHPELDPSLAPTHFELWNEPYLGVFSNGDANAGRYARLVKAAATAGHAANPSAQYLLEADVSATDDWTEWHDWIGAMYKAVPDLGNYFDAVAVHPYSVKSPDAWDPDSYLARWETPRIEQIRREFVAHGDGDKHFWVTEMGWSTCTGDPNCVTERQQADYLARFFQLVTTKYSSYVDAVFVYHYNDFPNGDPADKEAWFGLTRADGSKKPAYRVLEDITGG